MVRWCQIRVFLATCVGVFVGNLAGQAVHMPLAYAVIPCGLAGWAAGNGINALIAARMDAACQPIAAPKRNDGSPPL